MPVYLQSPRYYKRHCAVTVPSRSELRESDSAEMARCEGVRNGNDRNEVRGEGRSSKQAPAGADDNRDILRAILVELDKLDGIEANVLSVTARVSSLSEGAAISTDVPSRGEEET